MDNATPRTQEQRTGTTILVPFALAVASGAAYGLGLRLFADSAFAFGVMTIAFLVLVPFAVGGLAARVVLGQGLFAGIVCGWFGCFLSVVGAAVLEFEGLICIMMAAPLLFLSSTLGSCFVFYFARQSRNGATLSALALPFVVGPIEARLSPPDSMRRVQSEIAIQAPAAVVWEHIERVRAIAPEELSPSLASRLGFPAPVEATLDRVGVGGVRRATFAGGVLFLETITEWDEPRRLSFAIDPQTETIPPETLDEHVTIGGPYFDVLQGTYEIEPRADGCVLHLESRLRVSTTFNLYAGPWADALMESIQEQILDVIRARCEKAVAKR